MIIFSYFPLGVCVMGLAWTKPKKVKNDTLIVVSAALPGSKSEQDDIFNLWKNKKEELKADGFRIGKNKYKNFQWEVSYWHEVTETSFDKTKNGMAAWEAEFNKRREKWRLVMEKVKEVLNEVIDVDDIDDIDEPEAPKPSAPEPKAAKPPAPKAPEAKAKAAPKPSAPKAVAPKSAAPKAAATKPGAAKPPAPKMKSAPKPPPEDDDFSEGSGDEVEVEL